MWADPAYNPLREHLNQAIKKANNLKKEYGLDGFFFGELGVPRFMADKHVQTEIFKIYLNETWGKVDGYCFLGWSNLEFKFKDNEEAKQVIKEMFLKS